MSVEQNLLVNVPTWQKAELAWMLNSFVVMEIANKRFRDFENLAAQLGTSVTFRLAPRMTTQAGLLAATQPITQRLQNLTVTQATNCSVPMDAFQQIYNDLDEYMSVQGMAAAKAIGSAIEADVLKQFTSEVRVLNPQATNNGEIVDVTSGPYRFYGDGTTPINSFVQLSQLVANFEDYGAATQDPCGIIPITAVPSMVANQATLFTPVTNDGYFRDWELGSFPRPSYKWYTSNLLPRHFSGNVGENGDTLTLVSTNDPSGNNITQLTFSGVSTGTDPNAVFYGDRLQFSWGVGSLPNVYFTKFIGYQASGQPVQVRATAAAGSTSGTVTIDIYPALQSTPGQGQNLSTALQAGMQAKIMPSHQAGCLFSGNALYLAMPRLFDNTPYKTIITSDKDSGMSLRNYWGANGFGQNLQQYVWDTMWASTLVAENSMAILFPLSQAA